MNQETIKSPKELYIPYRYSTKNYVSTKYDKPLRESLNQSPVVFITGPAGCGKTQLARTYIKSRLSKDKHAKACEISQEYFSKAINKALCDEKITDIEKIPCDTDIFIYLRSEERTSIVLIDMLRYDQTMLLYISKLKLHDNLFIIVTTNLPIKFKDYPIISLNKHSFSDLKKIFYSPLSNSQKMKAQKKPSHYLIDFTNEELKQIFHIVDNNVMMISLIGETLYEDARKNFDKKTVTITKELLLDREVWLWRSLNLPKIHNPYTDNKIPSSRYRVSLISHALTLILKNIEKDFYQKVLPVLCLWAGGDISLAILTKSAGLNENQIKEAVQKGFLEYTDRAKKYVKLKPFIYKAIWCSYTYGKSYVQRQFPQIFDLNLNFCINQLDKIQKVYIESHDAEMDFEKYNSITLAALNHIHYYLSTISNDKNVTQKKKDFERWNRYLLQLMNFYLERGNAAIIEKFLSQLFLVTNRHQISTNFPNFFQTLIIDILDSQKQSLQLNRLTFFTYDIEKIQNQEGKYKRQLKSDPELHSYIIDCLNIQMDNIMNCLNRFILTQTYVSDFENKSLTRLVEIYEHMLDKYEIHSIIYPSAQSNLRLYYYRLPYYCLLSQKDTCYLKCVFSIFSILRNQLPQNSELLLKAEMQLLQCILTIMLSGKMKLNINLLKQHMFNIMRVFHYRMSFDTIILFFFTRIKYIYLSSREETVNSVNQKLKKCIDSFKLIIETQLTMDEEYKNSLLDILQNPRDKILPQHFL